MKKKNFIFDFELKFYRGVLMLVYIDIQVYQLD